MAGNLCSLGFLSSLFLFNPRAGCPCLLWFKGHKAAGAGCAILTASSWGGIVRTGSSSGVSTLDTVKAFWLCTVAAYFAIATVERYEVRRPNLKRNERMATKIRHIGLRSLILEVQGTEREREDLPLETGEVNTLAGLAMSGEGWVGREVSLGFIGVGM